MNQGKHSIAPVVRLYRRVAILTIGAIVFLIGIGGVVRSTGSGMGCPDWPKCFGQWVPPTDVSQLPSNYQELYKDHGYASMEFNALKTWIEYINRLVGVLIGFVTLLTAVVSLRLRKSRPLVTQLSFLGLFLVIVQGGIGAYVVRTNLQTGMVTIHMVVALVILMVMLLALLHSKGKTELLTSPSFEIPKRVGIAAVLFFLVAFLQVILGTQVREAVDLVAKELADRSDWIGELGRVYNWHKSFYYLVLLSFGVWAWLQQSLEGEPRLYKRLRGAIALLLLSEVGLGIAMHHFHIPAWIQPLHLLLATCILGLSFYNIGHMYIATGHKTPSSHVVIESI